MPNKKIENKLIGFNVRILDDGTFLLRSHNKNYEMEKEYSYQDLKELNLGIADILKHFKNGSKKQYEKDELER